MVDNRWSDATKLSKRTSRNSGKSALFVPFSVILLVKEDKAFVLRKRILHGAIRPLIVVLDRLDPQRCILVLSTEQSPLGAIVVSSIDLWFDVVTRWEFIVRQVDSILALDETVHLIV